MLFTLIGGSGVGAADQGSIVPRFEVAGESGLHLHRDEVHA
jgi:hypothetical protein